MLTSKEVMARTGISRATLNNYIALGLLPRPKIAAPAAPADTAPRIGFFEANVIERIEDVQRLKQSGMKMQDIAEHFGVEPPVPETTLTEMAEMVADNLRAGNGTLATPDIGRSLQVTVEDLPYPAYMVNNNFELLWWNRSAANRIFAGRERLDDEIDARNIFRLILAGGKTDPENWREALLFHMEIAKKRNAEQQVLAAVSDLPAEASEIVRDLSQSADAVPGYHILRRRIGYTAFEAETRECDLYASFFREGILFAYVPTDGDDGEFLQLMASRERVIRELLNNRQPFLSQMAIVAVEVEDLEKLRFELSPQDYFQFVNDIWACNETQLRRHHGAVGKHPGDGLVAHFFPEPDSNFATNAIAYALDLRETMIEVARRWRQTHPSFSALCLNIGIETGHEWFGTFRSASQIEFRALGDATGGALRLCSLARGGAIIANKTVLSLLPMEDISRLHYGISRFDSEGNRIFMPRVYARGSDIGATGQNLAAEADATLAQTAVTEIDDIESSLQS